MPFESFDLGKVLSTAEGIKGMRRDGAMDALRQKYLGVQVENAQQQGQAAQQQADVQYQEGQAKQAYAAAQQVLAVPAGQRKAFVEQTFPQFIPQLAQNGHDWDSLDEDHITAMAQGISAHAAAAAGIAPKQPEPFTLNAGQTRFGADGKPIANVAAEGKNPTSFDEFQLAQKDPAFKQFLDSRKGKGIKFTMPDGTELNIGGDGGTVSPTDLSGPTKTKLQESIVQSTDVLDRLNSMGQDYDPKFLQIPGRLKALQLGAKDLIGLDLNPDEKQFLDKFSTFKAGAAKNLSSIVNALSGTATSAGEMDRIKKGVPNDSDGPTAFLAKYRASVKDMTRAIMRANWALKNGIGVKSVDDLSKTMPLNSIDHVFEDRANEIWQGMGGTPETKQNAITQANREFGVAR